MGKSLPSQSTLDTWIFSSIESLMSKNYFMQDKKKGLRCCFSLFLWNMVWQSKRTKRWKSKAPQLSDYKKFLLLFLVLSLYLFRTVKTSRGKLENIYYVMKKMKYFKGQSYDGCFKKNFPCVHCGAVKHK